MIYNEYEIRFIQWMNLYAVYLVRFDSADPIYCVYKHGLIDDFSKNASFWDVQACQLGKRGAFWSLQACQLGKRGTFWSLQACRVGKRGTFRSLQACRISKRGLIGVAPVGVAAESGEVWPGAGVGVRRL